MLSRHKKEMLLLPIDRGRSTSDKMSFHLRRGVPPPDLFGMFLESEIHPKEGEGQFNTEEKIMGEKSYYQAP